METFPSEKFKFLREKLKSEKRQQRMAFLEKQDDTTLWALYQLGEVEALTMLIQKYHRQVVVLTCHRTGARLEMVEDAFGDFVLKLLASAYKDMALSENFTAFGTHCVTYIVRSKTKLVANSRVGGLEKIPSGHLAPSSLPKLELGLDFQKIIDFIPFVKNPDYRIVLLLSMVMGYESNDLVPVFGQRETAYNKRHRAIKALREVLMKGGIWEELQSDE